MCSLIHHFCSSGSDEEGWNKDPQQIEYDSDSDQEYEFDYGFNKFDEV